MTTKTESLSQQHCAACDGMVRPMTKGEALKSLKEIAGWEIDSTAKKISREYKMKNFMAALKFINLVGKAAEAESHHPDIHLTGYRNLRIDLSTHAVDGLSINDFILAAKINELPAELKK